MSTPVVKVIFYDGIVSKPHHATLCEIDDQTIQIQYLDVTQKIQTYRYVDMTLIGALGKIHPVIELQDDARIEFSEALPSWFKLKHHQRLNSIWKLERSPTLILFSVVFVAVFIFAVVKWGVPAASYQVAQHLPADTLNKLGVEAEEYVLEMTKPSKLPLTQQNKIIAEYKKIIAQDRPAKILFRQGGQIGANALAIPNNTIILTDELVKLTKDENEILGVLAHEQGHLNERHSLQQVLSSLGFSVIVIMITGDATDLFTSVPISMIGLSYSRDFESKADQYALKIMHEHQIPVRHLADFLERLAKNNEDDESSNKLFEFLSSHPATQERIQAVRDFEAKHPL